MRSRKILIITGESSGEANAAQLIVALKKKRKGLKFFVVGGEACRKSGAEILFDIKNLGIVGFKAAIQKLPAICKLRRRLVNFIRQEKPDLIVPVDFPDFNFLLLPKIHRFGIPVVYFISPQVWAWRKRRVNKIKRYVKRMIVLLPFEAELYKSRGIDAIYVGNPAVDRVKVTDKPDLFRKKHSIPKEKPIITFLPGSRFHEIDDILPIMLKSISLITKLGEFSFVIAPAVSVDMKKCSDIITYAGLKDEVILCPGEAYNAAAASTLIITKSGTSTIEMALIGVPFIVVYKTTPLAYKFIHLFYKRNEVALANIIAGGNLIPELIQNKLTPENICIEVERILHDRDFRARLLRYIKVVKDRLGKPGAADRAADALLEILK